MEQDKSGLRKAIERTVLATVMGTAAFGIATVRAGDDSCCANQDCTVLDGWLVHCGSGSQCHENFPNCCSRPEFQLLCS